MKLIVTACSGLLLLTGCASPQFVGQWKTTAMPPDVTVTGADLNLRKDGSLVLRSDQGQTLGGDWKQLSPDKAHISISGERQAATGRLAKDRLTVEQPGENGSQVWEFERQR